jgi:hypothetical protein
MKKFLPSWNGEPRARDKPSVRAAHEIGALPKDLRAEARTIGQIEVADDDVAVAADEAKLSRQRSQLKLLSRTHRRCQVKTLPTSTSTYPLFFELEKRVRVEARQQALRVLLPLP